MKLSFHSSLTLKDGRSRIMAENNLHDKISVKRMIRDLNINVATIPEDKDYFVSNSDINRPGIQLAGFYEHFPKDRIQVIGKVEHTYLLSMSENKQREVLDKYFSYDIPAVIIARGEKPNEIFIETAKKYKRVVLTTDMSTTHFINKLAAYIDDLIAPCEVISGVLVDVDGIGILIKGESGIGKSETALELIRRGHRLIADDVVEIKKLADNHLVGRAPEITQNLMEIRGIGLINIRQLFGIGAVKPYMGIDMVLYLESLNPAKYYERLGLESEYEEIFEVALEKVTVPVIPGKNLSIVIEIAARNFRQKAMGYNTAREFDRALLEEIASKDK